MFRIISNLSLRFYIMTAQSACKWVCRSVSDWEWSMFSHWHGRQDRALLPGIFYSTTCTERLVTVAPRWMEYRKTDRKLLVPRVRFLSRRRPSVPRDHRYIDRLDPNRAKYRTSIGRRWGCVQQIKLDAMGVNGTICSTSEVTSNRDNR